VLSGGGAGNDDHTIKVLLRASLIQQGNVYAKPVFSRFCRFDQSHPAIADAWMQNSLQLLTGIVIAKHALPQRGTVGGPIFMENFRSKPLAHAFLNASIVRKQLVDALI